MPTVNAGSFTVTRMSANLDQQGNLMVYLLYTVTSGGKQFHTRTFQVPASGGAISDQFGTVLAASVPGPLAAAVTAFLAQLDSTITNAASGGKLDL
jgi:hypothetical protein